MPADPQTDCDRVTNLQSTAFAAHAWLESALATATGLQTFNRKAFGSELPDNFLVVGAIEDVVQTWAGLGNQRRDETYSIRGLVRVYSGNDPTTIDVDALAQSAWAYVQQIVAVIAGPLGGDSSLGGNVIYAGLHQADELEADVPPAGGLEIAVEWVIACRAQVFM